MPSILETLAEALAGERARSALAELMQCSPDAAPIGVARAGSALVTALAEVADDGTAGAEAVAGMVDAFGPSALDEAASWLDKGDGGPGPAVVEALFGADLGPVTTALADGADIDPDGFERVLPPLAPLVLSAVAAHRDEGELDPPGLAGALAEERSALRSEAGDGSWLEGLAVAGGGVAALSLLAAGSEADAAGAASAADDEGADEPETETETESADGGDQAEASTEDVPPGRFADTIPLPVVPAFEAEAEADLGSPEGEPDAASATPGGGDGRRSVVGLVAAVGAAIAVAWLLVQVTDTEEVADGAIVAEEPAGPTAIQPDADAAGDSPADADGTADADPGTDADDAGDGAAGGDAGDAGDDDGAASASADADPGTDADDAESDTGAADGDDATGTDPAGGAEADETDADVDAGASADADADPPSDPENATDDGDADDATGDPTTDGETTATTDAGADADADADADAATSADGGSTDEAVVLNEELGLDPIGFEYYSEVIDIDGRAALDDVVTYLDDNRGVALEIRGHTDAIGDADLNRLLGLRRANAVKAYLVNNGVDADRLTAVGVGEAEPIASNATLDGQAANRRIELLAR